MTVRYIGKTENSNIRLAVIGYNENKVKRTILVYVNRWRMPILHVLH